MSKPASSHWQGAARLRRWALAALVVTQVVYATRFMLQVLPYHGRDGLELAMAALFVLLFTWITVGFWIGIYGFILRRLGGDRLSLLQRHKQSLATTGLARTAIVMPIYNEPIKRCLGGLRAVYLALQESGQIEHFDFFILSDSRDPDIWLAEQATWYQLCQELDGDDRLFYRRRTLNMHYKSGNIADFMRRWGRSYEYSIVLDADSLMDAQTILTMVKLMELEPRVGILQSSPRLLNGRSLFSRVQQFANQLYGPLFSTGLAALQLGEAAFWGHNAIIRNRLFMAHCGLHRLNGPGIFNGNILSHDFVEAAYMGRAGHEVWLEPELAGTYEESPPTLVDELTRDRRWAKGNMQHLWLMLFEPGLRLAHRMAFLNGIMSYVASPLWLAFLVLSTLEVTRLVLMPINYFPTPYALFPLWPEFNPGMALGLASSTLALLFLPKILAWLDALLDGRHRQFGGSFSLLKSVLIEMLASMMLAPVRMLSHTRYVIEAMLNVNLSWAGQNRTEETGWRAALVNQAVGTLVALSWSGFAYWLDEMFFYWSLPVALPLILAAPISVLSSKASVGDALARMGLLRIPEDSGCGVLEELERMPVLASGKSHPAFQQAVVDPVMNRVQCMLARGNRGGIKELRLTALRTLCLQRGPDSLTRSEITLLARDRESLEWLHRQAWRTTHDSYWGQVIQEWRAGALTAAPGND